jgi:hypothetical protein
MLDALLPHLLFNLGFRLVRVCFRELGSPNNHVPVLGKHFNEIKVSKVKQLHQFVLGIPRVASRSKDFHRSSSLGLRLDRIRILPRNETLKIESVHIVNRDRRNGFGFPSSGVAGALFGKGNPFRLFNLPGIVVSNLDPVAISSFASSEFDLHRHIRLHSIPTVVFVVRVLVTDHILVVRLFFFLVFVKDHGNTGFFVEALVSAGSGCCRVVGVGRAEVGQFFAELDELGEALRSQRREDALDLLLFVKVLERISCVSEK